MEIRRMSAGGIDFLIKEEGMVLKPYLCAGKVPTIGVGCTFYPDGRAVKMTDSAIQKTEALEILKGVLKTFEKKVASKIKSSIHQNQFDALTSFCFNVGTVAFENSTLLRLVNKNPRDPKISEAFEAWRFAGGKPLLLWRRKREYMLFKRDDNA